jgi:hypothetical protein
MTDKKEKKSRQIYPKSSLVRCTEKELEQIHKKAEKAGLSVSRYFVKAALSDGKVMTAEEKEEIRQLRLELRKIGINLNQIAYAVNASRYGSGETPEESEMEEIQQSLKNLINKLLKKV